MSASLATVIIPVYNVENYLRECLDSVCGQTCRNLQIILIDDGSTDRSGAICDEYAGRDSRIQVIHQANSDAGTARNAGLEIARGSYLYFVDSDDWIAENLVERSLAIMEKGYDICSWGMNIVEESGERYYRGQWRVRKQRFPSAKQKRRFLCRWYVPCRLGYEVCGSVFRRELVEQGGLRFRSQKKISTEDFDFRLRYLALCQSSFYLPGPFYFYRQRGSSTMHTRDLQDWISGILCLMRTEKESLADIPILEDFYIFGGGLLSASVSSFDAKWPKPGERIRNLTALFRKSEHWPFLLKEAEEAVRHRGKILGLYGPRIGCQVNALYRYILDGDEAAYRRGQLPNQCYLALRNMKDSLLHRKNRSLLGGGAENEAVRDRTGL